MRAITACGGIPASRSRGCSRSSSRSRSHSRSRGPTLRASSFTVLKSVSKELKSRFFKCSRGDRDCDGDGDRDGDRDGEGEGDRHGDGDGDGEGDGDGTGCAQLGASPKYAIFVGLGTANSFN
jgi:hypothetical protein